jgi:hypothetical protein
VVDRKKGVAIGFFVIDALAVNVGVGYLYYRFSTFSSKFSTNFQSQNLNTQTAEIIPTQIADTCGDKCRQYIDTKIAEAAGPSAQPKSTVTPAPSVKIVPLAAPTAKPKVRSVQYVTIPGSGSATTNDWTNLGGTEFYFDKSDYPGLVSVYFESNMKLFNGNGMAYVQLFDATHGIGVQGSDVQTNSQTDTVVTSGQVTFWAGKNLIRVQAKSLTADTAVFSSGRLKVIVEN